MRLSARNQLKGKILSITEGAVNGTVVLDIGGGNELTAIISMDAIRSLSLAPGQEAYAVIKASNVMVGVDD